VREAGDALRRKAEAELGLARLGLFVATSNTGKLAEFRAMAASADSHLELEIEAMPEFSGIEPFEESAPTFAENAAGKAVYYSRWCEGPVVADDSGLAVEALGGAPGVHSARYAGAGATDAQRTAKLLAELRRVTADAAGAEGTRRARFICAIALAVRGQVSAVISAAAEGEILERPRGEKGFGYDPVFWYPELRKTFAEMTAAEKNLHSHRGKAFRKLARFLANGPVL